MKSNIKHDACPGFLSQDKATPATLASSAASTAANDPVTLNPRHSGLDPESRPYPFMDPGSKSPRVLGDVRDDVSCSLASSERSEHGRQALASSTTATVPVAHARKLAGLQDNATAESSGENARPGVTPFHPSTLSRKAPFCGQANSAITRPVTVGTAVTQPSLIAERDISYVMDCVRRGEFEGKDLRALVSTIRGIPNSALAAGMKKSLPWFSGSVFRRRRGNEFFKAAWYQVFDLDHVEDVEGLKRRALDQLPFLRYAFQSVRDGVKLAAEFSSPITKEDDFRVIWRHLALRIAKALGVEPDSTPDPARACFLSYDPDLLTNPGCKPPDPKRILAEARSLEMLMGGSERKPASSKASTAANDPVTSNPRRSVPDPESRNNHHPASNPRHSGLDPESRNNQPASNSRHSGLDPESSPYPGMDPGSKSPRVLGDVRDDVSRSLASSERSEHGRQVSASSTEAITPVVHARMLASPPIPAIRGRKTEERHA